MMDAYEIKDDVGYDGWVHAACIIASEPINQHNLVYLAEAALGDDPLHEAGSEAGRSPPRTQAGGKALDEALTAVGLAAPEVQQGQIVL